MFSVIFIVVDSENSKFCLNAKVQKLDFRTMNLSLFLPNNIALNHVKQNFYLCSLTAGTHTMARKAY